MGQAKRRKETLGADYGKAQETEHTKGNFADPFAVMNDMNHCAQFMLKDELVLIMRDWYDALPQFLPPSTLADITADLKQVIDRTDAVKLKNGNISNMAELKRELQEVMNELPGEMIDEARVGASNGAHAAVALVAKWNVWKLSASASEFIRLVSWYQDQYGPVNQR
jgi:hypothetical protein